MYAAGYFTVTCKHWNLNRKSCYFKGNLKLFQNDNKAWKDKYGNAETDDINKGLGSVQRMAVLEAEAAGCKHLRQ